MAGKTIAEQLLALKATRESLDKKMSEVAQKSIDEGRSMNTAEAAEFDEAENEVKSLDDDIARLTRLEASQAKAAVPAQNLNKDVSVDVSKGRVDVQLKVDEKLEPGQAMARYAICLAKAKFNPQMAFALAERHYPNTQSIVRTLKAQAEGANLQEIARIKASVAAGTSTDATWAAPLVEAQTFMGDFISYLRPRTLIGQAQFRSVPFNVRIVGQTSGGTANWVGQGRAKPVTKFDFNDTTIPFTKIAAISVITQELARFSDPSAEMLVRDSLADSVIAKLDSDLFDPDVVAVANINPAGLLNGVAPIVPGTAIDYADPDTVRCAIAQLWAPWDSTNIGARPAYYTTPAVARHLALAREALGNPAFPGVTMNGGVLDGVPLRVSQYLANNGGSGGAPFILVDESEIFLADDGTVTLDASDVASIEMDSAPTGNSGTPTGASLVSMWQTNSLAFRAERFVWWGPRRSGAIQWIDGFPTTC
jgi:HK97 family phage major capsid protein